MNIYKFNMHMLMHSDMDLFVADIAASRACA